MKLIDDRAISRGMVKVESGEDLVESLQALAQAAGWTEAMVSGAGMLELLELRVASGETITLENAELISLAGHIHQSSGGTRLVSLQASVIAGGTVHAGRITGAMTGGLLLVVDAVSATAAKSISTAPPTSKTPAAPPQPVARTPVAPAPAAPKPPSFKDGHRSASKPLSQSFKTKPVVRPIANKTFDLDDDDDDENPIVNVGDIIDHPQLGQCEVVGDDDSGGTRIRVRGGKTRVLRLEALRVLPGVEDEEGRVVFKVAGPRKR